MLSKKISPTKIFFLSLVSVVCFSNTASSLILTCTSSTTSLTNYATVLCLSSTTNATPGICGANYPVKIQCTGYGSGGFVTATASTTVNCSTLGGNFVPILTYSGQVNTPIDNAHVADPVMTSKDAKRYPALLCLGAYGSDFTPGVVGTKLSNCDGFGTTLFSAPSSFNGAGNAHMGVADAYPLKRCITFERVQGLSLFLSTTTVGFGTLSPLVTNYATSNGLGTTTPLTASTSSFYLDVESYGNAQYNVSLQGATLSNDRNRTNKIDAIGNTPQVLVPGTNQFGVQVLNGCKPASLCGSVGLRSTTTSPYNTSNYAYAGSISTSTLIGTGLTDDSGSRFYVNLGVNIRAEMPEGSYTTSLTVVVTAEF
jgi:hypothetical protein